MERFKDILITRLQDRFTEIIGALRRQGYTQKNIAEIVSIREGNLSNLVTLDEQESKALGRSVYKRPLSATFIFKFIRSGVLKKADIYDGKAESKREIEFWALMDEMESTDILRLSVEMKSRNFDATTILKKINSIKDQRDLETILNLIDKFAENE